MTRDDIGTDSKIIINGPGHDSRSHKNTQAPQRRMAFFTRERTDTFLYCAALLIWLAFLIHIIGRGDEWIYDSLLTLALIASFYACRNTLHLKGPVLALALFTALLHNAGGLGLYGTTFILPFDHYMHFMAGLTVSIAISNTLSRRSSNLTPAFQTLLVIFATLGLGAAEEIVEFIFYSQGFVGEGLFFLGTGDYDPNLTNSEWANLSKDLLMDLLGGIAGALGYALARRRR
ncbi:MAG: hypothetical protein HC945_03055 [Nitrosarchaeum sp.]|nr:hypothetical protein [Nitrosarchaeum sp.]